mmetsp:Transcript_23244/g.37185  ORF Transcript_23244/g.37185 Transcript_23244/m.37185 type:complete len:209 (-) Transcript_23244:8-634(-)
MACARLDGVTDGHFQWIGCLCRSHLPIDERILNARIVLDHPVLAELEVQILHLVYSEWMVVAPIEVANLGLLLCNFRGWSCAWVCICALQTKLRSVHVVLFLSFDWGCREGASPKEEATKYKIPSVMDVEEMLSRHKLLCPKVLPEWGSCVVWDLESSGNASPLCRDELIWLDVPRKLRHCARGARKQKGHGEWRLLHVPMRLRFEST